MYLGTIQPRGKNVCKILQTIILEKKNPVQAKPVLVIITLYLPQSSVTDTLSEEHELRRYPHFPSVPKIIRAD